MSKIIHKIGFRHAWDGIQYAYSNHSNMVIHSILGLIALFAGFVLKINSLDMAILIIVFFIGLVIEMVNTSIESVVNLVTDEWKKNAKIAKDVAAGAMLVYALGAIMVALVILAPQLVNKLK